MVHSRLPVPSLLGLFGALLMLMGCAGYIYDVPLTDGSFQKVLTCAVGLYNQKRVDSTNYFKVSRVLDLQKKMNFPNEFHFRLEFVKTTSRKRAGCKMIYKRIQECRHLPGNQEKQSCFFEVVRQPPSNVMKFITALCW